MILMRWFLPVMILCLSTGAFADSSDRAADRNLFGLAPIYTLNARNVQRPVVNLSHEEFRNVRIDEARHFDGYAQAAEIIIPFGEQNRWEARLYVPFKTSGSARTVAGNQNIDIEGDGGVFEFATLVLQRELATTEDSACNSSVYFGFGQRPRYLETSINDRYNHRGRVLRLGYNVDNARTDRNLRLQATADARYYFGTDDLNPSSSSDNFPLLNLSCAVVYNPAVAVKPVFEVLYSTDFDGRQIVQAVPELIVPLGSRVEIKGGYAFGHSDGEGSTQTATIRTTFMF